MTNKSKYLVFFSIIASLSAISQSKSFTKNKLSLVYDMSYSPQWFEDSYSISDVGLINSVKYTNKEHSITVNYKIKSRLSLSLNGGLHKRKMESATYEYDNIKNVSFGIGLNLFFKKGLAPSDSHIGLVIKQLNYWINKKDVFNSIYGDNYKDNNLNDYTYQASGKLSYNTTFIGVKYNYTRMISKSLPVFWNIGCNLLIPVKSKFTTSSIYTEDPNFHKDPLNTPKILDHYKKSNIFKINLGLGYMF